MKALICWLRGHAWRYRHVRTGNPIGGPATRPELYCMRCRRGPP